MKERIQKFIDYKNITPGDLADILGVQRSNISHILNGRNKPGAAFIEKFLLAFPGVNARWLFTGNGPMIISDSEKQDITSSEKKVSQVKSEPEIPYQLHISDEETGKQDTGKTLDKVILIYSDGTFVSYNPA